MKKEPTEKKTNTFPQDLDVSTKAKRRKVVSELLVILEQVYCAEAHYLQNMPENLQESERADEAQATLDDLECAMDSLSYAY